jgi:hypothetical protein
MPDTPPIDARDLALLKQEIVANKELVNVKLAAADKALELQAREYESRLMKLNGEHATLLSMKDTYISREVYERDRNQVREEKLVSDAAAISNRRAAWTASIIALIGWALTAWFHFQVPH